MARVLDVLLTAITHLAPVAEIDCSALPPAGVFPLGYEFKLKLAFASGIATPNNSPPYQVAGGAEPRDVAEIVHASFSGEKWASRQVGLSVFVYGYDGSPVTKAAVEGDGPKPEVRWWPLPRRKK
jgi:hypothetical protein